MLKLWVFGLAGTFVFLGFGFAVLVLGLLLLAMSSLLFTYTQHRPKALTPEAIRHQGREKFAYGAQLARY